MDIKKYSPWSWFQHEKTEAQGLPVRSEMARPLATYPVFQLHQEIDRLFNDALRGFPSVFRGGMEWPEITPVMLSPNLDIKETDQDYIVSLEVPGVAKEDVDIRVSGNMLTIHGEKKQENKEDKANYHCVERHYGSFERRLALPEDANAENISARFKDGVLTIDIKRQAKIASKEAKKVEVEAA
ncbi:MAG: Hsp20/alpha crystallin family protein [Gammaproteobacteria bacterium]|nr:Hsp20/alpha crystallin family protein [Gammaproteobacteria bacterium]